MSAEAKSADLSRPWAIIIAIAPHKPQYVLERTPAITSLIWPTDE